MESKMTKSEKTKIAKWANSLTDEELKTEYYNALYDCLGSETEEMYERGYDIADIREQEKLEAYSRNKCNILESFCVERGITLFEE